MTEQELWNEEESDKRMNVIAQNGNDGLHYSEEDSDPYAEALNTVRLATTSGSRYCDDRRIDWKGVAGPPHPYNTQ